MNAKVILIDLFGVLYTNKSEVPNSKGVINKLIVDFIKNLQNSGEYTIVLASASGREMITKLVGRSKLRFDYIFSASELDIPKSSPGFYQYISDLLEVKPADMLLVDDSKDNIKAARTAGAHVLLYTSTISLKEMLTYA